MRDDSVRRRTIKTRGDMGGGVGGWHSRGGARHRGAPAEQQTFSQPAEPLSREVAVPETITVGELALDRVPVLDPAIQHDGERREIGLQAAHDLVAQRRDLAVFLR